MQVHLHCKISTKMELLIKVAENKIAWQGHSAAGCTYIHDGDK